MPKRKKWRPTKNQKRVMEEMDCLENDDPRGTGWTSWFGQMVFQERCRFKRPIVTLNSLVYRGMVQEHKEGQLDIEQEPAFVGTGQFALTDQGRAYVKRRKEWFRRNPYMKQKYQKNRR